MPPFHSCVLGRIRDIIRLPQGCRFESRQGSGAVAARPRSGCSEASGPVSNLPTEAITAAAEKSGKTKLN